MSIYKNDSLLQYILHASHLSFLCVVFTTLESKDLIAAMTRCSCSYPQLALKMMMSLARRHIGRASFGRQRRSEVVALVDSIFLL